MKPRTQKTAAWFAVLGLCAVLGIGLLRIRINLADLRREKEVLTAGLRTLEREWMAICEDERRLAQQAHSRHHETSEAEAKQAVREGKHQELRQALAEIFAARSGRPPRELSRPYPRGEHGDIFPELLADPEYARLYAIYAPSSVEVQYAEFFFTTSAAPEAVARLKNALVQREASKLEREELIAQHEVPARGRGELSHLLAENFDAETREILGEAGYAEFQRHELTGGQRRVVSAFEQRLSYSENPLQPAQAAELVAIMAGVMVPHRDLMVPVQKFNDEVIDRARSVLTPSQWEELKRFRQEQDAAVRP